MSEAPRLPTVALPTDQELVLRVVEAYFGVLLANRQLDVTQQAEHTAESILDRSKARYEAGLVVEAAAIASRRSVSLSRRACTRSGGRFFCISCKRPSPWISGRSTSASAS